MVSGTSEFRMKLRFIPPGNQTPKSKWFVFQVKVQSGASSRAKHGGAYFSAVRVSIKDPIAVPGRDEVQEC